MNKLHFSRGKECEKMCVMREEYDFSYAKENPYVEKLREQTATNNDETVMVADSLES